VLGRRIIGKLGMRARDVRAIAFWIASSIVLVFGAYLLSRSVLVSAALVGAYNAWLLTRPRARRVVGRLRGDIDWSGYYQD
jgi:hypothetical protein